MGGEGWEELIQRAGAPTGPGRAVTLVCRPTAPWSRVGQGGIFAGYTLVQGRAGRVFCGLHPGSRVQPRVPTLVLALALCHSCEPLSC